MVRFRTFAADISGRFSPASQAQSQPVSARMSWARLLKRVFDTDHRLHCGDTLKIIAAIDDPAVVAKILAHLGLPKNPRSSGLAHQGTASPLRYAILLRLRTGPSLPWLGRSLLDRRSPRKVFRYFAV